MTGNAAAFTRPEGARDENVRSLTIIADGAMDVSPRSQFFVHEMQRLWFAFDLDYVILAAYPPGLSAFNPIERYWAPITQMFGVSVLPEDPMEALLIAKGLLDGRTIAGRAVVVRLAPRHGVVARDDGDEPAAAGAAGAAGAGAGAAE